MSETTLPAKADAYQFAVMLSAGIAPSDAILYFMPEGTELGVCLDLARKWARSAAVQKELSRLSGGEWTAMTPKERIENALQKHYNEMAWFLFSNNYAEMQGDKSAKAERARMVLEAKLAGMAGQMDALFSFWTDLKAGKVRKAASETTFHPLES